MNLSNWNPQSHVYAAMDVVYRAFAGDSKVQNIEQFRPGSAGLNLPTLAWDGSVESLTQEITAVLYSKSPSPGIP
jgi:hypothetical protein